MKAGFHFENNRLLCDGKIIDIDKTPVYVYSSDKASENFSSFTGRLSDIKSLVAFSVKSCNNAEIVKSLIEASAGIDCVSLGEMQLAMKYGCDPKKIVLAGVGKTDDEIRYAVQNGILQINVESAEEVLVIDEIAYGLGKVADIALRINPHLKNEDYTHAKITTGKLGNKFGIDITDIPSTLSKLKERKNLRFVGFACHIGSQILDVSLFEDSFSILMNVISQAESQGFEFRTVDFGGGIGIKYKESDAEFDYGRYIGAVKKCLGGIKSKPLAIFEPGRSISANAGILLTKVLYIKETGHTKFAIIDAGMNNLVRPAMYGAHHEILPIVQEMTLPVEEYKVVGPICETSDVFGSYKIQKLKRGDILAIFNAGAYGEVMSSNYNLRY